MNRRAGELHSRTRSEILMSIGAAVFFVAVIGWRFASARQPIQQLGFGAVIAWALISLYWFRQRIWGEPSPRPDALAATGVEHYRQQLQRRRDHLRNAWIWHGPLLLACIIFVTSILGQAFPERLRAVLPLVVLLAIWTGFGVWRRHRQANELQREIDQIDAPHVG